jgi:hypothetical protein
MPMPGGAGRAQAHGEILRKSEERYRLLLSPPRSDRGLQPSARPCTSTRPEQTFACGATSCSAIDFVPVESWPERGHRNMLSGKKDPAETKRLTQDGRCSTCS